MSSHLDDPTLGGTMAAAESRGWRGPRPGGLMDAGPERAAALYGGTDRSDDMSGRPTRLPDTLTVEETADLLRVSARTIRRRIAQWEAGDRSAWPTHVIRIGRIIRIPGAELRAVLGASDAA
jgi:hypothetical protein